MWGVDELWFLFEAAGLPPQRPPLSRFFPEPNKQKDTIVNTLYNQALFKRGRDVGEGTNIGNKVRFHSTGYR
jgi:hypothetical protein